MFTGIIEEIGEITKIAQRGKDRRITVSAKKTPRELGIGQSVSVSGVCLTALDIRPNSFCADLAPETWERTSFSRVREGALVNLELPMKVDGRLGGHIVQGHVDGVGRLIELERIVDADGRDSENWWLHVEIPAGVEKYIVFKGSITIEGISLTVAKLEKNRCTIAIIPHTVELTNLGSLKPGDPVNLEADVIAKYVEKLMKRDHGQNALTIEELVSEGF
jgi:riboflavin synthase